MDFENNNKMPQVMPYLQSSCGFRVIVGVSEDTTSDHIIKATLDAVCFQTRDILEAMNKDYGSPLTELRVCISFNQEVIDLIFVTDFR